ncbi:MAG: ImmA/IrrE family metallo-endopeptidase [Pirellulales bacterium]
MARETKKAGRYSYEPDYAVPPGLSVRETMDSLGIDQRELAARAGLSAKHVNQIVQGVAPITHDTAIRFERVTGVPARVWNNLEANYREQLARLSEREKLREHLEWLKTIPTKELVERGVIENTSDKVAMLEAVLAFFGVGSVEAWKEGWLKPQFAFRRSLVFEGQVGAMATWLRLGELEAQQVACQPFDKAKFRAALDRIRGLTVREPDAFVPKMIEWCAGAGVALVLVPEIRHAPVSGAAKWLTPAKAMICLNLRGKSNDRFWFTFFHEAGHILNDSKKETFIDVEYADDERERQANRFAASALIPAGHQGELRRLTQYGLVEAFAARLGIAPGIVVGRLQREGVIKYNQFNGLKQKLEWAEED